MSEATINLASRDEAQLLFGNRDQFLREIRQALGVRLIGRGDAIHVRGTEEQIDQAERVFKQLRTVLRDQGNLSTEDVRTVLEVVLHGTEPVTAIPDQVEGGRYLRPRTDGQARYVRAMRENDLTLC